MSGWFRMYDGVLDDPKIQRLPGETFRGWVNVLCLAKRNDGILPALADIAFALRLSESETQALLNELQDVGLVDETETGFEPHNWKGRQYKSDVSSERVKRYRQRQRNDERNVTVTSDVTPPETETETETEKKPNGRSAKPTDRAAELLAELKPLYPKRAGSNPWRKAEQALRARLRERISESDIRAGLERYAAWCEATGKVGTETVMQAARFFGPGKEWENDWAIPENRGNGKAFVPEDREGIVALAEQHHIDLPGDWTLYQARNHLASKLGMRT